MREPAQGQVPERAQAQAAGPAGEAPAPVAQRRRPLARETKSFGGGGIGGGGARE